MALMVNFLITLIFCMGWDEECEKPESQQTEEKRCLPFFENLRENSLYLEFYVLNLGLMTS